MSECFSVVEGAPVPALVRTITQRDMVAYAGATWDWHQLHYDLEYVRSHRFDRPVVDGQMLGALLVQALQDWLGPEAFIHRLSFRFTKPVFAEETVSCEGEVTSLTATSLMTMLRVRVLGEQARLAIAHASAEVVIRP